MDGDSTKNEETSCSDDPSGQKVPGEEVKLSSDTSDATETNADKTGSKDDLQESTDKTDAEVSVEEQPEKAEGNSANADKSKTLDESIAKQSDEGKKKDAASADEPKKAAESAEEDKAGPMEVDSEPSESKSVSEVKAAEQDSSTNNIEYIEMDDEEEGDKANSTTKDKSEDSNKSDTKNDTNSEGNAASSDQKEDPFDGVTEAKEDGDKDAGSSAKDGSSEQDPMATEEASTEEPAPNLALENIPIDETVEQPQGADEELCIIPDTEQVISQDEPSFPLPDLAEPSTSAEPAEESTAVPVTEPLPSVEKFVVTKLNTEELKSCMQCVLQRKNKFTVRKGDVTTYLCSDTCLDNFSKSNTGNVSLNWDKEIRVKNFSSSVDKEPSSNQSQVSYVRRCKVCKKKTDDDEHNLTWEIMDFCNELCLSKCQKEIGSRCTTCNVEVGANSMGKYCVRFGNDVRQFCSSPCLEDYKKGLKVCSYCQRDMSKGVEGFLAPVGNKGQFKDFCSQDCMEQYDMMTNRRPPEVPSGTTCSVCKADTITIEYETESGMEYFCSDRCFTAYSFVANITPGRCNLCKRPFRNEILEKYTMFYDNVQYSFCSNSCQNIYIVAHRKIVPCVWCKVKKYNFDMIRRYYKTGPVLNMCSINCLSLFRVSINAVSSRKTACDYCHKRQQPMYHLTMSDATLRNFCSYDCVMGFQNQFKKHPVMLGGNANMTPVVPTGEPKKSRKLEKFEVTKPAAPSLPVISSVQSLADNNGDYSPTPPKPTTSRKGGPRSKVSATATSQRLANVTAELEPSAAGPPPMAPVYEPQVQIKHHLIVKTAPMPDQRNVATMCKLKTRNKATTMRPITHEAAIQTDERDAKKTLIPVPVPIFIPAPLPMFNFPCPYPLPFALPIPVPVFIPTTRNSAKGIMKEIKKIQVKIPTDPYEAELLMMAEMVAGDKKEDKSDSDSDFDDAAGADGGDRSSPEPADAGSSFGTDKNLVTLGDDMLQMALKMATELDEPAVDLEGTLTASTISAPAEGETRNEEAVDDPQTQQETVRGKKRASRGAKKDTPNKRRRTTQPVDIPVTPPVPMPPLEPSEKPDAHLCLKYTFGANAWKQWVTTKNAELEKSTKYVKPFKTELLQLSADELNYSLCLFVKEVRKPNGAEYAPDTIYYLCLGIQQYLFENGRIDNIFCDPYYEKFTDSLDEVARKFSVLYNDSHYIVTRVEEEHLWESKQLGAHSPQVLLSTLMFFNTKNFNLTSVEEHTQLSFSHIMKHWKRNPNTTPGSRNVLLRFYPPQSAVQNNARKKKVYEQQENDENPLRCPVKLYEFYLSKCPESVKIRNDVFYLQPERSCVPDSPVWYSTMALPQDALEKMLHRVKMVKEINVALLTS